MAKLDISKYCGSPQKRAAIFSAFKEGRDAGEVARNLSATFRFHADRNILSATILEKSKTLTFEFDQHGEGFVPNARLLRHYD